MIGSRKKVYKYGFLICTFLSISCSENAPKQESYKSVAEKPHDPFAALRGIEMKSNVDPSEKVNYTLFSDGNIDEIALEIPVQIASEIEPARVSELEVLTYDLSTAIMKGFHSGDTNSAVASKINFPSESGSALNSVITVSRGTYPNFVWYGLDKTKSSIEILLSSKELFEDPQYFNQWDYYSKRHKITQQDIQYVSIHRYQVLHEMDGLNQVTFVFLHAKSGKVIIYSGISTNQLMSF